MKLELNSILGKICPFCRSVSESTTKSVRSRWREDEQRQNLEWWKQYFNTVKSSDFLTGKIKDFQASFEWLVNPSNMTKVINGNYANRKQSQKPELNGKINDSPGLTELEKEMQRYNQYLSYDNEKPPRSG